MEDRLTRDLMRGSLELLVLSALSDGPSYGYEIQKRLRAATNDRVRPEAGTLYPLLHRLEAAGAIASDWDQTTGRGRKWYELTAAGRARLSDQADQWRRYAACIQSLLGESLGPAANLAT